MSDEEIDNCVDLLGSFDINSALAQYIWSKTEDKVLMFTKNYYIFTNIYL